MTPEAISAEFSQAAIDDAEELSALAIGTYVHTFGAEFALTNSRITSNKTPLAAPLARVLARDRVLTARIADRAIGYVQLGPASRPGEIEIRRLYVEAGLQGQGIGSELLGRALCAPEAVAASAVRIDVW